MSDELPPAADLESKGFTLKGALAFVEQRWGPEAVARVLAGSPAQDRPILDGRILPSAWYPFRVQVGLYQTIDQVLGAGDLALCWEIGKFTSEYEMTRFHKVFLRTAGLDLWVRTASLMWRRYYSAGALVVDDVGKTAGSVRVTRFNPLSKAFCYDFGGWLHRTIELAGFDEVAVQHGECVLDGAAACRFAGSWENLG